MIVNTDLIPKKIQTELPDMPIKTKTHDVKKRNVTTLSLGAGSGAKIPLSIKIDPLTNDRLKIARHVAKTTGGKFNVSLHLEKHLALLLDMLEEELEYSYEDYKVDGKKITKIKS